MRNENITNINNLEIRTKQICKMSKEITEQEMKVIREFLENVLTPSLRMEFHKVYSISSSSTSSSILLPKTSAKMEMMIMGKQTGRQHMIIEMYEKS